MQFFDVFVNKKEVTLEKIAPLTIGDEIKTCFDFKIFYNKRTEREEMPSPLVAVLRVEGIPTCERSEPLNIKSHLYLDVKTIK